MGWVGWGEGGGERKIPISMDFVCGIDRASAEMEKGV